jgi:hypothetical protein
LVLSFGLEFCECGCRAREGPTATRQNIRNLWTYTFLFYFSPPKEFVLVDVQVFSELLQSRLGAALEIFCSLVLGLSFVSVRRGKTSLIFEHILFFV